MSSPTVLIVGAGPVGLALAGELALGGVRAVIVEQRAEPDPHAPGGAINSTVVGLLDQRGLANELRQGAIELPVSHFSNLWLDQTALFGPHLHSLIVPQPRLEARLGRWVAELGVAVRRGAEVTGLSQGDEGVTVDLFTPDGTEQILADYVVGCDGANSTVRRLAGIGFPGRDAPCYGLIGDLRIPSADFQPEHFGAKYLPTGALFAAAPAGPDIWRVSTSEFGAEPADAEAAPTLEELDEQVTRLTGVGFKNAEALWLDRSGNPSGLADRYREGRVFVAGDAAHVFYPLNGQRLSAGFEDAANLGWKLAAHLRGWAGEDLLDSYQDERLPAGRWACENVAAQLALATPPESAAPLRRLFGELLRFGEVNRFLAETAQGLGVRHPVPDPEDKHAHPLLGLRLPPVPLRTADGTRTDVSRLLHPAHGVLLDLTAGSALVPELSGWAGRVDIVSAEPVAEVEAAVLLLRPDGHIAWATSDGADLAGLDSALTRWFGVPARPAADG